MTSKQEKQEALKVFIVVKESTCGDCGQELSSKAWITLDQDKGALCLSCADLDHLIFLPSGNAALTRRSGKYSTLSAVVLRWSRARKRWPMGNKRATNAHKVDHCQDCQSSCSFRSRRYA